MVPPEAERAEHEQVANAAVERVWYSTTLQEAYEQLVSLGVSIHRGLGSKPSSVTELFYKHGRCRARVKQVHPQFETLAGLCERVAKWARLRDFHYCGESPQALLDRLSCARSPSGASGWTAPPSSRSRAKSATSAARATTSRCTTGNR